ncbi:MAG: Glycerophosphodiester phosphodiesterase [Chloroflexi bacterium]|nr:Glycerophosphodiester phosphodiesterase [Chloroflexota bacterium]
MKKKLLNILIALLATYGILTLLARPVPDHPFFDHAGVLVMAHQGGDGLRPGNTLAAFENAVALGVDVLEMDIHSTKDGEIVVMHDNTVDRTTNGTGPIQSFTLGELKELDAGYHWTEDEGKSYPFRGQGIAVPTLREVFRQFPDMPMNIEIKQSEPSLAEPLCQLIRAHGMKEKVLIASFKAVAIKEFRRACPEIMTTTVENEVRLLYGLSMVYLGRIYPPPAEALQVPEYEGNIHVVKKRFVEAAHRRNMEVHVWTVNEINDMQRMLDVGVDGIITDYPDRLLDLLGR